MCSLGSQSMQLLPSSSVITLNRWRILRAQQQQSNICQLQLWSFMLCFDESFFVFSSNEVTKFGTIFGADHYNVFFKEKSTVESGIIKSSHLIAFLINDYSQLFLRYITCVQLKNEDFRKFKQIFSRLDSCHFGDLQRPEF